MSTEITQKVEGLLKQGSHSRMSEFQLKNFVIGKEPTHQSKMWRCLQELETRRADIKSIKLEIDEVKDQKALLNIEIDQHKQIITGGGAFGVEATPLDVEKATIMVRRTERKLASLDDTLVALQRRFDQSQAEHDFFLSEFERLNEVEECKPFDDPEAQLEFWNESYRQKFNLNVLLGRPIDPELVKLILCLEDEAPIKKQTVQILEQLRDGHKKAVENGNKSIESR